MEPGSDSTPSSAGGGPIRWPPSALGFVLVDTKGKPVPKEIQLVREWLDNWKGLGHVVVGMERPGSALNLDHRRRLASDVSHINPQLSADGFATADKPWRAVQRAAWDVLTKKPLAVGSRG